MNKHLHIALCALVMGSLLGSCGVPKKASVIPAPPVESPKSEGTQASVAFVSGSAQVQDAESWVDIKEGDTLTYDAVVRTGKGSICDIQFGHLGIVHLMGNTTIFLQTIEFSSIYRHVDIGVTTGSVVAKVSKLTAKDRFQIMTNTVSCGVRGTRFAVTKPSDESTVVAVAEGTVSLIPAAFDPKKMETLALNPQDQNIMVQEVEQRILRGSIAVEGGSEAVVNLAAMKKSSDGIERLQEAVVSTLQAHPGNSAPGATTSSEAAPMPTGIEATLAAYEDQTKAHAPAVPREQTTAMRSILKETANLHLRDETGPATTEGMVTPPSNAQPHLAAPVLLSPMNEQKVDINTSASLWLSWNAVQGASSYKVSVYTGSTKTGSPVRTWTTSDTSVQLAEFSDLRLGDFVWEVVAWGGPDGTVESAAMDSRFSLVKGTRLTAPAVQLPQN